MAKHVKRSVREEKFNVYLDYLRRGKLPIKACRAADIDPRQVRARRVQDPQFAADERDAINEFAEEMEQVLIDAANGTVRWAKDQTGELLYDVDGRKIPARLDTKAAMDWLRARNQAVFNQDRQIQRHELEVKVNVRELFSDIGKLREALQGRAPALELPEGDAYEDDDDA